MTGSSAESDWWQPRRSLAEFSARMCPFYNRLAGFLSARRVTPQASPSQIVQSPRLTVAMPGRLGAKSLDAKSLDARSLDVGSSDSYYSFPRTQFAVSVCN
jgi:hypothetical protein